MGLVFITHNLGVVAEIADTAAVMYAGQIVEHGSVAAVFGAPLHPYTRALLAAVPEGGEAAPSGIPGVVPQPHAWLPGCRFAPRCPRAVAACTATPPALEDGPQGRRVRCFRWSEGAEAAA
jgi:peptide/nickel transport system permease protein